jgi:uncharacterized protein (TIGR02996 family)
MNEHAPFLAAILADPGDPGPRRVFADWLEERGDRRGAWLRLAVEPPKPAGFVVRRRDAIRELENRPAGPSLLRLLACWCARLTPLSDGRIVWELLVNRHSREAVAVAELFACGLTDRDHLGDARDRAQHAARAVPASPRLGAAAVGAQFTTHPDPATAAANVLALAWGIVGNADSLWQDRLLAGLLRFEAPLLP